MSLKLLLDEDLSYRVAAVLRGRGLDAVSVHEIDRTGLADVEQLRFAAGEGRVIVTFNRADFQALDANWRLEGREHAGILWCNERTVPRYAIEDLVRALQNEASLFESLQGLCLPLTRASDRGESGTVQPESC
jgi:predicted nuclease of predicted toxin-antitoxin system